ncbi:Multiple PDZ domain protein [Taenia crassiceps]|uniref:Multiple PDZ domain protein n=1 Tax=Taenia crassiceps TaxID=6207 RepID=A0ABR4QE61_9CEST
MAFTLFTCELVRVQWIGRCRLVHCFSSTCQNRQENQSVTTTSGPKLPLNPRRGVRRHRSNNLEGRLLQKNISKGHETSSLRVLTKVPQKVNPRNEVVGCIYATHVSSSSRNVKQIKCRYTTQQTMQVQPMQELNNPEVNVFERNKREAFEQNWSEIFSVAVNPSDGDLQIKVARGSLCGISVAGVIVCDLCAVAAKLPLKVGDLIVQVENAPLTDADPQDATSIRLLVKRLKECPSLTSSDSNPETPERQSSHQIHRVDRKESGYPKKKIPDKHASMMRMSHGDIKQFKSKERVPIVEKKVLRCIQGLSKGDITQTSQFDLSKPGRSALPPKANINPGSLDPPCCDNLQRKYGELSGEIIIVEITAKEIQEILSSNYRNLTTHQEATTPLGSPTIPVTSFQKPSSHVNSRVLKSLGISLCGNRDLNQMAVLVCGLRPGSIAEVDGRITVGDQLLELNEHVLYGRSHLNAGPLIRSCLLSVLNRSSNKRSKTPSSLCFVICRNPDNLTNMAVAPLSYATNSPKTSRRGSVDTASGTDSPPRSILQVQDSPVGRSTFEEVHATRLLRGRNGFGFAIMDKSFTNEPGIYIKQLVENSPAALDGTLRAGDRILRVDRHDALHASYDSVLEWLRSARHQVRIVVSRVRLFKGDNRPLEDEEPYKMGFRKRLSAPLVSSLIHAFMHPSSSSASSKKSSLQLASMEDTVASSEEGGGLGNSKHKGLHRPTVSGTFDLLSPNIGMLSEVRRASCPDAVIPGFAKRLAAKSFLGVVPMSSLTQLAGPPIPVLPLGVVSASGDGDGGTSKTTEAALRGRFEAAIERIAAAYRGPHSRRNGANRDEVESTTTRPILPGQKTLIRIRKNSSLSLGISLIGGSETSLGVLQVHEIFSEGAVALDGRLEPGDRLLAVNNESLSNLPYAVAVSTIAAAFSGQTPLQSELDLSSVVAATSPSHCPNDSNFITLVVERPGAGVQTKWYDQEVTVDLPKKPASTASAVTPQNSNQHPTVGSERSGLGVIVCDLIKGSTAQMDGRIMVGDQILAINEIDVENSSQEEVAMLLKTAQAPSNNHPDGINDTDQMVKFRPDGAGLILVIRKFSKPHPLLLTQTRFLRASFTRPHKIAPLRAEHKIRHSIVSKTRNKRFG